MESTVVQGVRYETQCGAPDHMLAQEGPRTDSLASERVTSDAPDRYTNLNTSVPLHSTMAFQNYFPLTELNGT
jgi:hypothetical protein